MPVTQLINTDDFEIWKTKFNQVVDQLVTVGETTGLTTNTNTSVIAAINELVTKIGYPLTALTTSNKTSLVSAINELVTAINGLTIGEEVQGFNAILTAISALTTITANKILYTTGTNTFATSDFTAFARSLLDDADAGTMRNTLLLGGLAVLNTINNNNWSGTPLALSNGGHGGTNENEARTNLGVSHGKLALFSQAWN